MTLLNPQIPELTSLSIFQDFARKFNLNYFTDESFIYVFNTKILMHIYQESDSLFIDIYDLKNRTTASTHNMNGSEFVNLEEARKIYARHLHNHEITVANLSKKTIAQFCMDLDLITNQYPDIFSDPEKYASVFRPAGEHIFSSNLEVLRKHGFRK